MKKRLPSLLFRLIALLGVGLLYHFFGSDGETGQIIRHVCLTLIWLISGTLVNSIFELIAFDLMGSAALGGPVPVVIRQFSRAIFFTALITLIVHFVFEKSVVPFLTALGAGGVVIGLAAQRLIADIFNGLAMNAEGPFRIGDWIALDLPGEGMVDCEVRGINWRTTILRTATDKEWVIPNHVIGESAILNHWRPGKMSWIRVEIVIDFETPPERIEQILGNAGRAVLHLPGFDTKCVPDVLLRGLEDRGVRYTLAVRFAGWGAGGTEVIGRSVLLHAALTHLRNAGIAPAYEKQDVFLHRAPDRNLDVTRILSHIALFDQLSDPECAALVEKSRRVIFHAGDELVREGDQGDSMFVLLEGLLEVFIWNDGQGELRVDCMGPGQFFGEMSLMTGDPRSATVRARSGGVAYEITKEAMMELLASRPELLDPISRVVTERRLRMTAAHDAPRKAPPGSDRGFAGQLMGRMRSFFGLNE